MKEPEAKRGVSLTILGHQACLADICGNTELPPWRGEELTVWLHFDDAVDSILSFAVSLPVREYSREDFLKAVTKEAEKVLADMLEKDRKKRAIRTLQDTRKRALEDIAGRLKSMIGLE